MDTYALWLGYAVLYAGGTLLVVMVIGVAAWQALEWWYRRFCDLKHLREFIQWKRGRFPG
jgi:hypothetical protein